MVIEHVSRGTLKNINWTIPYHTVLDQTGLLSENEALGSEGLDWNDLDTFRAGNVILFVEKMLRLEHPGKGPRGRSKRTFMNVVKGDPSVVGVGEEDTKDRIRWRQMI